MFRCGICGKEWTDYLEEELPWGEDHEIMCEDCLQALAETPLYEQEDFAQSLFEDRLNDAEYRFEFRTGDEC